VTEVIFLFNFLLDHLQASLVLRIPFPTLSP
jgi:hypothetical protein